MFGRNLRRYISYRRRFSLRLIGLEARIVPTTYTVNWPGDGSFGSSTNLRQAIAAANSNFGADTIVFSGVAASGTSTLTAGDITISDSLTIIGPGAGTLTISGNNADRIFNISNTKTKVSVTISDLQIANGKVAAVGGGIVNQGESLTLNSCIIANNSTTGGFSGGGISSVGGSVTINGCTITGNNSSGNGGGIDANTSAILKINDCTIAGNIASNNGGGIGVGSSSLLIERSTLSGNYASGDAGGLYFAGAVGPSGLVIRNSTLSNNNCFDDGGAIFLSAFTGTLEIQNATIAANGAGSSAGAIYHSGFSGTMAVESSIIAGNTDNKGKSGVINGGASATMRNSAMDPIGAFVYANLGGNLTPGIDLKLGPLANNGGPTQTHVLLPGSPCIDAGSNPAGVTIDQRGTGYPRIIGGIPDIGAFENHDLIVKNANDTGPGSLRLSVTDANTLSSANTITFDPAYFNVPRTITLATGQLLITDSVTINGPGSALAKVSGKDTSRVFELNSPGTISVTMTGLSITDGFVAGRGAGILNDSENLSLIDCVIQNNVTTGTTSAWGGGISLINGASLTCDRCIITENKSGQHGGGVGGVGAVVMTLRHSTIANNSAGQQGGAIFIFGTSLLIENCTLSGNSATFAGAVDAGADTTIRNSTVSSNVCTSDFAGISSNSTFTLVIQNSTVTANVGTGYYGGVTGNSINIESSIIQGNTATKANDIFCPGTVTAKTSAFGDINNITTFKNNGGNLIGKSILLGPLADNGGPTKSHMLLAGSPCINAGSNPVPSNRDQRGDGFPRIAGGVADIGAVEFASLLVTNVNDNGIGSLRQAILDANGSKGQDTIKFDPIVFATSKVILMAAGEMAITDSITISGPGAAILTINGNKASRILNATKAPAGSLVSISGVTLTGGQINDNAGAIIADGQTVTLTACGFNGNAAANPGVGGAVSIINGTLIAGDCTFTNNTAYNLGGAIYANLTTVTIQRCTLSGNLAAFGAGIYTRLCGLSIFDSVISANTATVLGGGMLCNGNVDNGTLTMRNCTISSNIANSGGAGIDFYYYPGQIVIQNSTLTQNMTSGKGGGILVSNTPNQINLESTIVQGNTAPTGLDIYTADKVNAKTTALGSINGITTFMSQGGNLIGQDIKLGPLADNGGPTKTHALLPGSAAIDKGSNPMSLTLDQRGGVFSRNFNGTDIGAYEFQPGAKVVSVQVNDNTPQRSRVTNLTVTFDSAVTLPANSADAFQLKRQSDDSVVGLTASLIGNVVTLNFTGGPIESGSLADGRYTLTILASQVNGGLFDGDSDGGAGDSFNLIGNPINGLFRLYGDADGNGAVTASDFNAFRTVYGSAGVSYFDFDGNSTITAADFNQFRQRYGVTV